MILQAFRDRCAEYKHVPHRFMIPLYSRLAELAGGFSDKARSLAYDTLRDVLQHRACRDPLAEQPHDNMTEAEFNGIHDVLPADRRPAIPPGPGSRYQRWKEAGRQAHEVERREREEQSNRRIESEYDSAVRNPRRLHRHGEAPINYASVMQERARRREMDEETRRVDAEQGTID